MIKDFITYILNIFNSTNPNLYYLRLLLILTVMIVAILLTNHIRKDTKYNVEGFSQKEQFVCKREQEAIDSIYVDMYDSLHNTQERCQKELIKVIEMTEPSPKYSKILDIGSGTGYVVNELLEAGYDTYGVDINKNMIKYSERKYPDGDYILGDVMDPMIIDKSIFTHILCTYFTIYSFEDKKQFFKNCYYWMQPNSYLIIHLVDKNKFANLIPYNNTYNETNETINNERLISVNAIFEDFSYKGKCNIGENSSLTETFTDKQTGHIRQNEHTLYIEDHEEILKMAQTYGFILKGKSNMYNCNYDKHQYLYTLERPL